MRRSGAITPTTKLRHFAEIARQQGITLRKLSHSAQVPESLLVAYQAGEAVPSSLVAARIARALNVTMREAFPELGASTKQIICATAPTSASTAKLAERYGVDAGRLNDLLAAAGIQCRQGKTWVVSPEYADSAMVYYLPAKDTQGQTVLLARWTPFGQRRIHEVLSARGLLPKCGSSERPHK